MADLKELEGRGRARRRARAERVRPVAARHAGVISRKMLRELKVTRFDVRDEVLGGRWHTHGRQTVVIGGRRPEDAGVLWSALWEVGRGAVLDGVSSLIASGLKGFKAQWVDVSVPLGNRPHRPSGVVVHVPGELGAVCGRGIPRTEPEVALIRAATWAVSDRQAALLVAMAVQQRLVDKVLLQRLWASVQRNPRKAFLSSVIRDVCDGAEALGELDFALLCRERGLPEPTRQSVRRVRGGRAYLDVEWADLGVAVEIDGSYHFEGLKPMEDALRQNDVVADGTVMLRIPLVGLRLARGQFMDQVEYTVRAAQRRRQTSPST